MPSNAVDICNIALGHLGEASIVAITDDNTRARACNKHYDTALESTLRSHRWNFAQKRIVVSKDATAPAFGWSYRYALPADCLRVLEVNDSEQGANDAPWIIEGDFILTDSDECRLVYVSKIEDVTKFDPLFVDALALALAVRLTETIRGTTGKTSELTAQYERITAPLARRVDANEARRRKPLRPINSLAIRARFSGHVAS